MLYDDSKWQLWGCWKTAQCSMTTVNDSCEVAESERWSDGPWTVLRDVRREIPNSSMGKNELLRYWRQHPLTGHAAGSCIWTLRAQKQQIRANISLKGITDNWQRRLYHLLERSIPQWGMQQFCLDSPDSGVSSSEKHQCGTCETKQCSLIQNFATSAKPNSFTLLVFGSYHQTILSCHNSSCQQLTLSEMETCQILSQLHNQTFMHFLVSHRIMSSCSSFWFMVMLSTPSPQNTFHARSKPFLDSHTMSRGTDRLHWLQGSGTFGHSFECSWNKRHDSICSQFSKVRSTILILFNFDPFA